MIVNVKQETLKGFKGFFDDIKNEIDSQDLNLYRAKKYRDFAVENVKSGTVNIRNVSGGTKKISGEHQPENLTGKLLDKMGVRPSKKNDAQAGYFGDKDIVPTRGKRKITYTDLAIMQHTGYRIPVKKGTEEGEGVRRFLRANGIYIKSSKEWLIVPPRPFMYRALDSYERQGLDDKAVQEYFEKVKR